MSSSKQTKIFFGALFSGGLLLAGWTFGGQARAHQAAPTEPAHHAHRAAAARAYVPAESAPAAAPRVAVPSAPQESARRPGYLPPAEFHPRDPNEWQGMKVDLTLQPPCMESLHCGQAMSCNLATNKCGPCEADADCGGDEACVLDHCVLADKVACRGRSDCPDDALCVLSGLSAGPRGNADMRAYCQSSSSGAAEARSETVDLPIPALEPDHPEVYGGRLLDLLRDPPAD